MTVGIKSYLLNQTYVLHVQNPG